MGTIAGCMVTRKNFQKFGYSNHPRRGRVSVENIALKRFKDDVKEVAKGYDCGLQIKNYNDIKDRRCIGMFPRSSR